MASIPGTPLQLDSSLTQNSASITKQPGYHGCGCINGNREKFPKRKEKKEGFPDLLVP
jgi:hypothetical protein